MPQHRRVIRRFEPSRAVALDERLWPINVALLALAGVAVGVVVVAGGWNDPSPLHNGWIRLVTLGLTVGGIAWAANTLSPRRARRLHLAVLVSLITHILLAIALDQGYLQRFVEKPDESEPKVVETPPTPIPVHAPPEDLLAAFERPVTVEPAEVVKATRLERDRETDPRDAPWQPEELPETVEPTPPAEVAEREPQTQRPRRAEELAKRKRRPSAPAATVARAAVPMPNQPAKPELVAVEATNETLQRTIPSPNADSTDKRPSATTAETPTVVSQPARRRSDDQPHLTDLAQAAPRRAAAETSEAATDRAAEVIAKQPSQPDDALDPTPVVRITQRSTSASPRLTRTMPDRLAMTVADALAADRPPRQDRRAARPTLARTEEPERTNRAVEIAAATDVAAAAERPSTRTIEPGQTALAVQPTGIERASPQSPRRARTDADVNSVVETSANAVRVAAAPRRAARAVEPSISPLERVADAPRRTLETAAAPASPVEAPSALAAQNSSTRRLAPAPSSLAVSRGSKGFAGRARSPNAGRDLPATEDRLAPSPSLAARRASASQQQAGPSVSPTMDARIAKAMAGANAPSAPALAQPFESAEVAGSDRPGTLAASASAAIERRFAAAPFGEITASAGSGALDTGAEQIVPSEGTGRAAGGGQPRIELAAAAPTRRASNGGGAPAAALAATVPAPSPAAPPAAGGGSPPAANQLAASEISGTGRTSSATVIAKPRPVGTFESAAVGPTATATIRRADRGQAVPGLASGGGTAAPRARRGPATAALTRAEVPTRAAVPQPGSAKVRQTLAIADASGGPASPGQSHPASNATDVRRPESSREPTVASEQFASRAASTSPFVAIHRGSEAIDATDDTLDGGGLGPQVATTAGLPDRLARPQSEVVRSTPSRFVKKRTAGLPTIRGSARRPAPAFARRAKRGQRSDAASPQQPTEKTEAAIELGLAFLAKWQLPDGRWSFDRNGVDLERAPREQPTLESDAAATGLALLAFLGAGYDHYDDKYRDKVAAALNFLVRNQNASGDLFIPGDDKSNTFAHFYSHGIATIAVCEAYGMTGDPKLAEPAQKAIDFIAATQNEELGGWRYYPGKESDLSVTGWQIMALKSGELAGLNVPAGTLNRAAAFVEACRDAELVPVLLPKPSLSGQFEGFLGFDGNLSDSNDALFTYYPNAPSNKPTWAQPSTVMTSVGLLTSLYLGKDRDDQAIRRGADHLLENLPAYEADGPAAGIGSRGNPRRDTYYWYYGTQVMFHMRGDHWKAWNEQLHPLIVNAQTTKGPLAGSWNPFWQATDRWASVGGRLYISTMNLLSLEVYYRHLPLHEATAR